MNDAVAGKQGHPPFCLDEIVQAALHVDVHSLGIGRGMAERLHDQIGRESKAGQFLEFVRGHGAGGVLGAHRGDFRFAIGPGTNTGQAAGPAHDFLGQGKSAFFG